MARVKKLTSPDSGSEDKVYGSDWNDLVDDYLSQTDTEDQSIASNISLASGKKIDGLDPSDVPSPASQLCRIETGTYTGDGTTSHAITGVGFRPKYVEIWRHFTSPDTGSYSFLKIDQFFGDLSFHHDNSWHRHVSDRIISLDADGFTVDDAGSDLAPNKNGEAYDYIAFG